MHSASSRCRSRPASTEGGGPGRRRRRQTSEVVLDLRRADRDGAAVEPGRSPTQNPIINDAFAEPTRHWHFGDGAPEMRDGRRDAGYIPPCAEGGQLSITDELS